MTEVEDKCSDEHCFVKYNKREMDLLKFMVERHKCHEQPANWDSVGMEMREPTKLLKRRYIEATTPAEDRVKQIFTESLKS